MNNYKKMFRFLIFLLFFCTFLNYFEIYMDTKLKLKRKIANNLK